MPDRQIDPEFQAEVKLRDYQARLDDRQERLEKAVRSLRETGDVASEYARRIDRLEAESAQLRVELEALEICEGTRLRWSDR